MAAAAAVAAAPAAVSSIRGLLRERHGVVNEGAKTLLEPIRPLTQLVPRLAAPGSLDAPQPLLVQRAGSLWLCRAVQLCDECMLGLTSALLRPNLVFLLRIIHVLVLLG